MALSTPLTPAAALPARGKRCPCSHETVHQQQHAELSNGGLYGEVLRQVDRSQCLSARASKPNLECEYFPPNPEQNPNMRIIPCHIIHPSSLHPCFYLPRHKHTTTRSLPPVVFRGCRKPTALSATTSTTTTLTAILVPPHLDAAGIFLGERRL